MIASTDPLTLKRELTDDGLNPLREAAKRQLLELVHREVEQTFRRFETFIGYLGSTGLSPSTVWAYGEMVKPPREPAWFAAMYERAKRA